MNRELKFGFQELPHTADWALRVWAPSKVELFIQAALGMYSLLGIELADSVREERVLHISGGDTEILLVEFLSELLYYLEESRIAFDDFHLTVGESEVNGQLSGSIVSSQRKEIKAVTYHEMCIQFIDNLWQVIIVFDV
jgi:SHS2 domain-containing protein